MTASPPASTTGRWPAEVDLAAPPTRRGALEDARPAQDRRGEPRPARPAGQGVRRRPSCTTWPGRACCTPGCCASRGRKARLAALDEAAIRHAAGGADRHPARGPVRRLLCASERRPQRRASPPPSRRAQWDGARDLAPALSETGVAEGACRATASLGRPRARSLQPPPPSPPAYSRPYIAHGSMGPSCGLAVCEDGELTVWTHAQGVYPLRDAAGPGLRPGARRRSR